MLFWESIIFPDSEILCSSVRVESESSHFDAIKMPWLFQTDADIWPIMQQAVEKYTDIDRNNPKSSVLL